MFSSIFRRYKLPKKLKFSGKSEHCILIYTVNDLKKEDEQLWQEEKSFLV